MRTLIVAEHEHGHVTQATLATIGAALKLKAPIDLLLFANASIPNAKAITEVEKILLAKSPSFAQPLAESMAPVIASLAKNYTYVLAPSNTFGKNVLPRAAALADVEQISDVMEIQSKDTFLRPIYAGNALETIKSSASLNFLTIRTTGFDPVSPSEKHSTPEESLSKDLLELGKQNHSHFVKLTESTSDRPELTSAQVVVSGGRGFQSKEKFKLIEELADRLNAAIGASRAAVDAGFVPNDYQVGQTGKVVAPDLYVAIGISGAIQHIAGMKDSKIIVAINKDPDAPIFQIADYGLVGDLFKIIPELIDLLDRRKA